MTRTERARCTTLRWAVVLTGLTGLLAPAGCRSRQPALLVFAAASTSGPLEEVGRAFEAAGGGRVQFAFGATSELARQARAGAPVDVFLSADSGHMDELVRAGIVDPAEVVDLLSNQLVVVVPAGRPTTLPSLAGLAGLDRVALADPTHVPAGLYARRWLETEGLWDRIAPRIVPAADVRAALAAVASGAVAAGVVYATDARTSTAVRVVQVVPRDRGPSIVYPVAPLTRARGRDARAFVGYLRGPEAGAAFARAGFVVL